MRGPIDPRVVGATGERCAAAFLRGRGLAVVARNVQVGRGEIDIVAVDGATRVAIEVRSITGDGDPTMAFDHAKYLQVSALARQARCSRVDLVAIRFGGLSVDVHWIRGVG